MNSGNSDAKSIAFSAISSLLRIRQMVLYHHVVFVTILIYLKVGFTESLDIKN